MADRPKNTQKKVSLTGWSVFLTKGQDDRTEIYFNKDSSDQAEYKLPFRGKKISCGKEHAGIRVKRGIVIPVRKAGQPSS